MIFVCCLYVLFLALSILMFCWERKAFYDSETRLYRPGCFGAGLHYLDLIHWVIGAVVVPICLLFFWQPLPASLLVTQAQAVTLSWPWLFWLMGCTAFFMEGDYSWRVLLFLILFWVLPFRRLLVTVIFLKGPTTLSQKLLMPLYVLFTYWPESLLCASIGVSIASE